MADVLALARAQIKAARAARDAWELYATAHRAAVEADRAYRVAVAELGSRRRHPTGRRRQLDPAPDPDGGWSQPGLWAADTEADDLARVWAGAKRPLCAVVPASAPKTAAMGRRAVDDDPDAA